MQPVNRRDLLRRIGGAFCAAAMELGCERPMMPRINQAYEEAEFEEVICFNSAIFHSKMGWKNEAPVPTGVRYNWTRDGWEKVDKHLSNPNAE